MAELEALEDNVFFNALTTRYADLWAAAARDDMMVVVPQSCSLDTASPSRTDMSECRHPRPVRPSCRRHGERGMIKWVYVAQAVGRFPKVGTTGETAAAPRGAAAPVSTPATCAAARRPALSGCSVELRGEADTPPH